MVSKIERSRFRVAQASTQANPALAPEVQQTKSKSFTLRVKLPRLPAKNTILKLLVWVLIVGLAMAWWLWPAKNTIPPDIRSQIGFQAVFPTKNYSSSSFQILPSSHTLEFSASQSGTKTTVTEQALPANVGADPSKDPTVLLNKLGVHYYTQTQSKLGVVSIAKFWTNAYLPYGQTAILGKKGVLVLARADKDLSLDQWSQFFNGLEY